MVTDAGVAWYRDRVIWQLLRTGAGEDAPTTAGLETRRYAPVVTESCGRGTCEPLNK